MIEKILEVYGLDPQGCKVEPLTSGLINNTWKVSSSDREFIFQRINHHVFKKPVEVAANIRMIARHLEENSPGYLFVSPVGNAQGEDIYYEPEHGYFRAFPYIRGSHTINTVTTPTEAFEAALQFGKFTRLLAGFEARLLHYTIPDFHNLTLRYEQFQQALKQGDPDRIKQSEDMIRELGRFSNLVETFEKIRQTPKIRQRVTHHDTKISNVLFGEDGKGLCVIDLDTVMPGYFISDVGDMMRTYLSPANEEEKDFSLISVREDVFGAIVNGYISSMGDELIAEEQALVIYSGSFMIYMQALRFLTDHLNRDVYYGARYPDHNFVRAGNQLVLLKCLESATGKLQEIVDAELRTRSHFIF